MGIGQRRGLVLLLPAVEIHANSKRGVKELSEHMLNRVNFDRWQEQDEPTQLTNAHKLVRKWLEEVEPVLSLEKLMEIKSKFPEIVNT